MKTLFEQEVFKLRLRKSTWLAMLLVILMMFFAAATTLKAHTSDAQFYFSSAYGGFQWFAMVLIVISAANITSEFQLGTIKQLIIQADNRWKIYYTKLLVILIYDLLGHLFLMLVTLVIKWLLYGHLSLSAPYLYHTNLINNLLLNSALDFWESFLFIGLVFLIASISNNSAVAISVGIVMAFAGEGLSNLMIESFNKTLPLIRWNPFNMLNFQQEFAYPQTIAHTYVTVSEMGMGIAIWSLIFLLVGQLLFQKRRI